LADAAPGDNVRPERRTLSAPHNPWLAIDTGTVPAVRARELKQAWEEYISDGEPPEVREPIADSWRRSSAAGVDPAARLVAPLVADHAETAARWEEHPLATASDLIRACMSPIADGDGQLLVVSDADGVLLWVDGPESVRLDAAEAMNFTAGAGWGECDAGTNAVGTALAADHAVQVFAAEHFNEVVQEWTCAAAPVHDPDTGELLGVIDLTGRMRTAHPHSLACATATAQAVRLHLTELMHQRDAHLLARYEQRIAGPGRRVLVTRTGRVIAGDGGWIGARRLLLPPGGGELLLPSGVHAFAEPLGHQEAFVVRPAGGTSRQRSRPLMDMTLLGREQALVSLNGQQLTLTRRQSEILALLSRRTDGMTTEELAADLYGDAGNPGTVRVQVHRMRKLFGAIVETDPYRLALDVRSDLACVEALLDRGLARDAAEYYRGPLLPHSEAPGIVRERDALDAWMRQAVMTSDDPEAIWAWVQTESGKDDLLAWRRLVAGLQYADPRHSLAAARARALRELYAPELRVAG
jgi:hypothetical protein